MSEPDSPETTAIDSLDDDLAAAFEGAETPAPDDTAPADASAQAKSPASGEAVLEPPKHWSDADKAIYGKLTPEAQSRWIAREKEIQKGLDEKFQEIAGFRRERERIDEVFKPYARELELHGIDRTQLIQSLLSGFAYLRESPNDAVKWLAQQYGADLAKIVSPPEQPPADPQVRSLQQNFQHLNSQFQGIISHQQAQAQKEQYSRVSSFAESKGPDGKPLHPYFDEVSGDIITVLNGGEKDLEKAYAKAVRMNDAVFAKVQAEAELAKKQQEEAQRKERVAKAKRAAVGGEGTSANGVAKRRSIEEELSSLLAN